MSAPAGTDLEVPARRTRLTVVRAAAGLAAAMGVGRFVYTPLLPLMQEQTGVSHSDTALVATANYLGYFLGAIALAVFPAGTRSVTVFRASILALVASELAMTVGTDVRVWLAARVVAGVASAAIFVYCATAVVGHPSAGITFTGVGIGIATSGVLVAVLGPMLSWTALWVVAAASTVGYAAIAWSLPPGSPPPAPTAGRPPPRTAPSARWWTLGASYFLEGLGYIILGTFLVAAVSAGGEAWTGPAAWVVVGLAAVPSPLLWAKALRRWSAESLLAVALLLQSVSALLPALVDGPIAAVVAAVLFGGTFMGITLLAMDSALGLGIPRAAAALTAIYGLGQILGPLVVAPMLGDGFRAAFICAAAVLVTSALLAGATRRR
ncbi:YbfB/YjiJ family MFS transporter [Prescottella equi]|uniref:YbfB/YjiJ family MFS transporter n=1 Tax=Rhodococcus hoagii TaxID=43767 RepID=UPI001C76F9A9|nr:YbfB/YjiJ family MFS transporter [Prescottella equi]BCN61251.1 MFS transporter [Prescottella equi]